MTLQVEIPDDVGARLLDDAQRCALSPSDYLAEVLRQAQTERELGDQALLENRPDWQAALDRADADIRAGRVHSHEEVLRWHHDHAG